MNKLTRAAAAVALTWAVTLPEPGCAQDFPKGPIKVVIPVAAGGTGDVIMRTLIPILEKGPLKTIVLDYRAGAGGNVGADHVRSAPADGHTLLFAILNNLVVNQFLFKDLGFDPLKAFAPISLIADVPAVVFVSSWLPATTLREFIDHARANPGKINYGSAGVGTTLHLAGVIMSNLAGLNMVHVPYRGVAPAMAEMLSGQIQLIVVGYNVGAAHARSGAVRAVAVASRARLPAAPDVPTTEEAGFGRFQIGNWWGLVGPAGMDPGVVALIQRAFHAALDDAAIRRRFDELALTPIGSTPAEFASFLAAEAAKWEPAVKASGAKVE